MATGTGNLPYPMSPVSPFDVITSQAENERIANIKSLADGTGVGDGAVTAAKIDFTTFSKGWNTNNGNISISTSNTYSPLTSVTIKLDKASTVEINALASIRLANNQETNIRIMNGSTGLFETGNQSSDAALIRTHGANIQVDLPAGTHNLLLQIRAFNGSAGTHTINTRNATMSVRVV